MWTLIWDDNLIENECDRLDEAEEVYEKIMELTDMGCSNFIVIPPREMVKLKELSDDEFISLYEKGKFMNK